MRGFMLLLVSLCTLILHGCGGGGDSGKVDTGTGSAANTSNVVNSLPTSTLNHAELPSAGSTPTVSGRTETWRTQLGVGVQNLAGHASYIANMPMQYRYTYMTGDPNGSNWSNWNSPRGEYARWFLRDSDKMGLIPVMTWYQLVHASPNSGQEPPIDNIRNVTVLAQLFDQFRLLMQVSAEFGKTTIVHIEPDLSGFMQSTGALNPSNGSNSNNALVIPIAELVNKGIPEAAGLPNTIAGFYQLVVKLRNRYAPNVLLGWHVSLWATGHHLIWNNRDPIATAQSSWDWYRNLNAPFDVVFSDLADTDAGFQQIKYGINHWWEADDFVRMQQFVTELHRVSQQPIMLWQIPVGNTVFATMNNTEGHYQDNRAEYFFGSLYPSTNAPRGNRNTLQQWADAGVVALMFGAGKPGCTNYWDLNADGITNTTLIGKPSSVADDDGGYLRESFQRYAAMGRVNRD